MNKTETIMKKIFAIIFIFLFSLAIANATENQLCGIGARILKDPFGKKTFILQVLPNSPAEKFNLPEGAEIISVDNVKTKSHSRDEIIKMILGEPGTVVNLKIKYNGKKSDYSITRGVFKVPQKNTDKKFDMHWHQVAPEGLDDIYIPETIAAKVSRYYYQQYIVPVNYWVERKISFKRGYDACMTYSKNEQNSCLMNLVNREIAKTDHDRQIEMQAQAARQQAAQNFINTMNQVQTNTNLNNINNSLQQQNFQLQNTNIQLYNLNNRLRGW